MRGSARLAFVIVVVGIAGATATCGGPDVQDGEVVCGANPICPPGFVCAADGRCYRHLPGSCGNGVVEGSETCDPSSTCPSSCSDGNACTADRVTGSADTCNLLCEHETITTCTTGDSCCPAGCDQSSDGDCSKTCGDGVLDPGETCEPPTFPCPSCDDGNACTRDTSTGSELNCNKACGHDSIVSCANGDGCCPAGCATGNDSDCSPTCGNHLIDPGETCDPPTFPCPSTCNDGDACTIDTLNGSEANCNVTCGHTSIVTCGPNDMCCPAGCTANNDVNCSSTCGNGTREPGETCDPQSMCMLIAMMCNDGFACTTDTVTGAPATCNVVCTHNPVSQCTSGDGCCPPGCSSINDSDCGPITGCPDGGIPPPGDGGISCSGA